MPTYSILIPDGKDTDNYLLGNLVDALNKDGPIITAITATLIETDDYPAAVIFSRLANLQPPEENPY